MARRREPRTCIEATTPLMFTGGGVANIIMQLSIPAVGRGVVESRVASGAAGRRPVKRSRTTSQYLAVALVGTTEERDAMRRDVRSIHNHVTSTEQSPVRYSANSRELQLWVAACLFRGFLDSYELVHGTLSPAGRETLYQDSQTFGTTLEVRPQDWPADFEAFQAYWDEHIAQLQMSPAVHESMQALADSDILATKGAIGKKLHKLLGPWNADMVNFMLPPEFRRVMGWTWTAEQQQRAERFTGFLRRFDVVLHPLTVAVYRAFLADYRCDGVSNKPPMGELDVRDYPVLERSSKVDFFSGADINATPNG